MEDAHVAIDDANAALAGPSPAEAAAAGPACVAVPRAYYGVYDGHGGRRTAELAERTLHETILKHEVWSAGPPPHEDERIREAFVDGFRRTDDFVLKMSKAEGWSDGATVAAVVLEGARLYVGNLGDAEVVVASKKGGAATCVSEKHKPSSPEEKSRIEQAGGHVLFGRILGSLAVSKSLGDFEFKYPQNKGSGDFVSCVPSFSSTTVTPENPFLIVACDGLWDKLTYQDAVSRCAEARAAGKTPQEAAQVLVKAAFDSGSLDNISCVVVYLNW